MVSPVFSSQPCFHTVNHKKPYLKAQSTSILSFGCNMEFGTFYCVAPEGDIQGLLSAVAAAPLFACPNHDFVIFRSIDTKFVAHVSCNEMESRVN